MSSSAETSPSISYLVKDKDPECNMSTDPWGKFLFSRYTERKSLFQSLNESEKNVIRKELGRVDYLRSAIEDRKLAEEDAKPLLSLLAHARESWNMEAYQRCREKLSKGTATEIGERDRQIMEAVLLRKGKVSCEAESWSLSDESLDTSDQSTEEPCCEEMAYQNRFDADKPDYGYNGWYLSFESGKGGHDNPLCYGQFPHQKIEIQKLLYNKEKTPLKRVKNKKMLQYFHLPANNMAWIEAAIKQYYGEEGVELDNHRLSSGDRSSKTRRILKHDLWRGRQRGDQGLPAHARQIGARCSLVPVEGRQGNDISLFMPYLHWEIENRLKRMCRIVQQTTDEKRRREMKDEMKKGEKQSRKDSFQRLKRLFKRQNDEEIKQEITKTETMKVEGQEDWYRGKFADLVLNWRIKLSKPDPKQRPKSKPWQPRSDLARLLWFSAKAFEIIDEATEERTIREHLWTSAPIHIRRTLDQFFHWTIARTEAQDQLQVVCRGTRSRMEAGGIGRVVMVDQLWMWILDENTILTSFPRRWGRNKPDPSAVHRAIRHHIGTLDENEPTTIYDLALIIIDECSKIFFDRTKAPDLRPEVVTIFGSAISELAEMKTMIYDRFGRDVNTIDLKGITDSFEAEKLLRKSLNIHLEWSVLVEAQHIIDELQIMQQVFNQQLSVVKDFQRAVLSTPDAGHSVKDRAAALIADIEMRRDELIELEKLPFKTRVQQQAGIFEAKAAIQRADEAALQGRSIMVFTVFTIIFLPLSFFATVFGMNNVEMTGKDSPMRLGFQLRYMCKSPNTHSLNTAKQTYPVALSGVVILVSLAIAFSGLTRTAIAVSCKVIYRHVVYWLGIYEVVTKTRATQNLKDFDKQHKKRHEDRYTNKRLQEISSIFGKDGVGTGTGWTALSEEMRRRGNGNSLPVGMV
ncbi:hypothetical protein CP533_0874 [Ophiocordyceps camponoti-saundersi (nom. inval.)]|nr:hypothetical protein CP533_0874 [Ophiocordyceps camponoti-saundersi (nom. inval.)]